MSTLPTLETPRLLLRPFFDSDAPAVQQLASDRLVADTTLRIPHPYPEGVAEAWIATHEATWEMSRGITLAIVLRKTGELIGAVGITLNPDTRVGELGYWIGVNFWRRGFATEAANAMIEYGFSRLELEMIMARHFARNPASGRVLEKTGLRFVEERPAAVEKSGRAEDVCYFSMGRADWLVRRIS